MLTAPTGDIFSARSSSFGYFQLFDIPAEITYTLEAKPKGLTFRARVISVEDNLEGLEVIAEPNSARWK